MKNAEAFNLFEKGNFSDALKISVDSINKNISSIQDTPYVQCKLIIATWMNLSGNKDKAYAEVLGLMKLGLDSPEIRNTFLMILGGYRDASNAPLVFGLGTGRSGSTSLTAGLLKIKNTYFSHEHPSLVPWQNGEEIVEWHIKRMKSLSAHYSLVGDVSHWWLPYVEHILSIHPNSYFIITKRDRSATIGSFLKIKGGGAKGSINHWVKHDGTFFKRNLWDICYPKFSPHLGLEGSLKMYWDEYYRQALRLQELFPKNVLNIDIEDPNKDLIISSFIRSSCGLFCDTFSFSRKNVSGINDGANFFQMPSYLKK